MNFPVGGQKNPWNFRVQDHTLLERIPFKWNRSRFFFWPLKRRAGLPHVPHLSGKSSSAAEAKRKQDGKLYLQCAEGSPVRNHPKKKPGSKSPASLNREASRLGDAGPAQGGGRSLFSRTCAWNPSN